MSSRFQLVTTFALLLGISRSSAALAQWKGTFDRSAEAVAVGEDLVLQFSQGAYHLPNRWAGIIVYASESTPDDPQFRLTTGYSYHAEDKKLGMRVSTHKYVSKQPQINGEEGLGGFPQSWGAWRSKNEYVVKEFSKWKAYEDSLKGPQFFVHPYCAPILNPTTLERNRTETHIEQMYFAIKISSLGIREEKDHTVLLWGPKEASDKPSGSRLLRFDNESKRPTEMSYAFHPKWDPIKFASMPSQVTSRISVKWKRFDTEKTDEEDPKKTKRKDQSQDSEQWLPIEVIYNVTSLEGECEELTAKVFWKFGEDVPDGVFHDPRKHPFTMVQFDGVNVANVDKEAGD
jgi:hypothetical protein